MKLSNFQREIIRFFTRLVKNTCLIVVNALQKIIHTFIPIDNKKIFYFPVNLKTSGNTYALLNEWVKRPGYRHIYLTKDSGVDSIPSHNVVFCNFGLAALYHYSTSKFIIREAGFVSFGLISRPDTKVIQLWHAAGAFKKMSSDVLGNSQFFKINRQRDIRSWELLLCSSDILIDIYSSAFNGFDKRKIFVSGLPRNDYLFYLSKNKGKIRGKYTISINKRVVLYAPTFRDKATQDDEETILNTIGFLSKNLSSDFLLAVRLHPSTVVNLELNWDFINFNCCTTEEALVASDILITDYSSVIFDYSLLVKPIIFYAPDLEKYYNNRGFYFDYNDFVPGPIYKDCESLLSGIQNFDYSFWEAKVADFKNKYNPFFDGNNSKRVLERILQL